MKKTAFLLIAIICAVSASAITWTSKATIKVTSSNSSMSIIVAASPDLPATASVSNPACSILNTDGRVLMLYVQDGGEKWQNYGLTTISNVPVTLVTDANTSVNIGISSVSGTETMKLYDLLTGSSYDLTNGQSIDLTVTPNTVIEDRFVINYVRTVDSGELELCHQNGKLTINNNPYSENIQVLDAAGVVVLDVPSANTPQDIDLSSLSAGQYTVSLNNGARTFIIRVQ